MNQPQNYQDALYQERQARQQAEYDSLVNAIAAAQSDAESAQRDVQLYTAQGDHTSASDAYRRLARAESRLTTLEGGKQSMEDEATTSGSYPNRSSVQQQYQQQLQPMDIINGMPNLSPRERQWMVAHQDLLRRPETITRLQGTFHRCQDRGIQRDSDEYFREFDNEFAGSAHNGHGLTPQQREHAKWSGVSEEVYAENARKLEALKAKGYYSQG
jgi:hypothetical protein